MILVQLTRPDGMPFTPLQAIAWAITRLTWREAEIMGAAIQAKLTGDRKGDPLGSTPLSQSPQMASAIASWAEGWEKFT